MSDAALGAVYLPAQHQLYNTGGYLTAPSSRDHLEIVREYLVAHAGQVGATGQEAANFVVTDRYTDEDTGITHLYLRQTFGGLEIVNSNLTANVMSDGRVLSIFGGFVTGLDAPAGPQGSSDGPGSLGAAGTLGTSAVLPASQALSFAAAALGLAYTPSTIVSGLGLVGPATASTFTGGNLSLNPIPSKLQYVATDQGVKLAWNFVIRPSKQHWYDVSVDVGSGQVLDAHDWVNSASYRVYPLPGKSPDDSEHVLVSEPTSPASPYGWHDTNGVAGAEYTDTRGNNVSAQLDLPGGGTNGYRPDGGGSLVFDFPADLGQDPSYYQAAALTNLYYWVNLSHDIFYAYGFTELAGNFQVTNYTGQGAGGDPVIADGQDGETFNNGTFATPPDGTPGQMSIGIFSYTTPYRDGSLDNQVIVHEYGHGVSNRLVGGPSNASAMDALQSSAIGEGLSDWFAMMLTQEPADPKMGSYPFCEYLKGELSGGTGIRLYAYSYDTAVDPMTLGRFNTNHESHDAGMIIASALWDLNWLLIDKYGFGSDITQGYHAGVSGQDGGNNLSMQVVMTALKLMPADPSFLQVRDAMLQADQVLTDGENQLLIWNAFARRGMGYSASDGPNSNSLSVVEAFDVPVSDPVIFSSAPGGKAAAPVASVTFNFSRPMNTTSFSVADDVPHFTGPDGSDLRSSITGYAWVSSQTLTLYFAPQTRNGTYTITIGPGILAAADGHPMDQNTNLTPGEDPGDCYTTTFRAVDTLYSADMDVDPGWTLDAGSGDYRWQYGAPAGVDGDPTHGHTGSNVVGYNLNGDYPSNMTAAEYAITPVFSTVDHQEVTLSFWRWLGVEIASWDNSAISVWDGITWTTVWTNDGTTIDDGSWQLFSYTLPASANDNPTVRIRFEMGPTDETVALCGWNIDDLSVTGARVYQDTQGPRVVSATPSGAISQAPTSIEVIFSEPIEPSSFSLSPDVVFLGPRGDMKSRITGYAWLTSRLLSLQLSSLSEAGNYTLVIGPNITDDGLSANPMDQNQNGAGGEFADACTLNFALLRTAYSADMSVDPNWTLDPGTGPYRWQWGTPTGGGSTHHDPASGFTGPNVVGYNLAGDYANNMTTVEYATTPSFSTIDMHNLTLSFRRYLLVGSSRNDHVYVEAWDGASWTMVWQNSTSSVIDTSWQLMTYALPASLENKPDVKVRWGMGTTSAGTVYPGWNIDDVSVTGSYSGPYGLPDSFTVQEDSTNNPLDVLANDTHSSALVITGVTAAQHGTVTITDGGTRLSYTPTTWYDGADTFVYSIADADGGTDINITVTMTVTHVNHAPQAGDDDATVYTNSSYIPIHVLSNDTYLPDPFETLGVTALGKASHGTAVLMYGQVFYTPQPGYVGSDTFTYTVSDPYGAKTTATVHVTVQDPATPRLKVWLVTMPVASGDYTVQVWAQVVHAQPGEAISDLAITIYTPGTIGQTLPKATGVGGRYVSNSWNPDLVNYFRIHPTTGDYDHDSDLDAIQLSIGDTGEFTLGLTPVLLATQTWTLVSGNPRLAVYVAPSSRHWTSTGGKAAFDTVESQGATVPLWTRGDVNRDNLVNAADIDALFAHYGAGAQYDVNYDGLVNSSDVDELVRQVFATDYGDTNLDQRVDFLDFQALLDHWQYGRGWVQGDFNGSGTVDFFDFQTLLDNWNPTGFSASGDSGDSAASAMTMTAMTAMAAQTTTATLVQTTATTSTMEDGWHGVWSLRDSPCGVFDIRMGGWKFQETIPGPKVISPLGGIFVSCPNRPMATLPLQKPISHLDVLARGELEDSHAMPPKETFLVSHRSRPLHSRRAGGISVIGDPDEPLDVLSLARRWALRSNE